MSSKLLEMMFQMDRWEDLLEKAEQKGINKGELRKLCTPEVRAYIYAMIKSNKLEFSPGHQAKIPKDDGGVRIVYVGETIERVLCSLINDCLFELFPEMIHPSVKSYIKGLGTGKVALEVNEQLAEYKDCSSEDIIAIKYDYHHFFDDISREAIMELIDIIEQKLGYEKGTESVCNLLRRMYNSDLLFDVDNNLIEQWSGCRQGNACGSWIADAVLYEQDKYLSEKYKYYVRYSDDLIVFHDNPDEVTRDILSFIEPIGVSLNPKKIQVIHKGEWFKFLGFSFCNDKISLSKGRLKKFQKEIENRTIKKKGISYEKAIHNVVKWLYIGVDEYSWSTSALPIINDTDDIQKLNTFVMDCLRAVKTGKHKIGGLGYVTNKPNGVVARGTGRNVTANRNKTPKEIDGYLSLMAAKNAMQTSSAAYKTLIRCL